MVKVPFRKNYCFVGRAEILKKMEQNLHNNQLTNDCVPLVLSGLGGMGKTQLMLKYYYTHRGEYKDVFWLSTEGTAAAMDMFRLLAESLGIKVDENERGDRDAILVGRIRECLEARKERWLLMLDNVETITDVSRFIPDMGGDVIITTRDHVDKRRGSVIHVDKMSNDDALLLLVGPENHRTPSESATGIIKELDCMPLAIDIVRAYVDRTGTTLESYLKMYKTKNSILLENQKDVNVDQYKSTIATVWDLSFEKMGSQNKLAELILSNCAILQPDAIPVSLFKGQATMLGLDGKVDSIHEAIGVLVQFSFVKRAVRHDSNDNDHNSGEEIIVIHRLVQAVIRDVRMELNDLWGVYERLISALDKEIVSGDCYNPQVQRMYNVYLPHIRQIFQLVDWRKMDKASQSRLGKLISRTVDHYVRFGHGFQSVQELAKDAIQFSEESNGLEHQDTAISLLNLARLYRNQGKYDLASPLLQRALAIMEKVFGPDSSKTARYLYSLAASYEDQRKYDLAEPLYQRSLSIEEKFWGPDHSETAETMNGLANLYK